MNNKQLMLTVIGGFIAYSCYRYNAAYTVSRNESIASSWNAMINDTKPRFAKILIGFNACTDLIVRGKDLLQALSIKPGLAKDHSRLDSLEKLQQAFAHFFSQGVAAERPFVDGHIFEQIIEKAQKLPNAHWFVGGNAALIAQKMSEISPASKIELVGPVGPKLKELINSTITISPSSSSKKDEVHLIMEYEVGESWGGYIAPVATRFITSHDIPNSEAEYMEALFEAIPEFQPDLIIFSGLHMLEATVEPFWQHRLNVMGDLLETVPTNIPVHLELASMTNAHLLGSIADKVFQKVTAIGLNEQELIFLNRVKSGPDSMKMASHNGQPLIHQVTEVLAWMLTNYGKSSELPNSHLTRVHFHSLTFHIIATVPGHWQNIEVAVAAGTEMAGKQACDVERLVAEQLELQIPYYFKLYNNAEDISLDAENPVIKFKYANLEFAFSPVLVCKKPLKTVGLGDAISATGLLFSAYDGKNR